MNYDKNSIEFTSLINNGHMVESSLSDAEDEEYYFNYDDPNPYAAIKEVTLTVRGNYKNPLINKLFKKQINSRIVKVRIEICGIDGDCK